MTSLSAWSMAAVSRCCAQRTDRVTSRNRVHPDGGRDCAIRPGQSPADNADHLLPICGLSRYPAEH